jgi:hypothetical protein
MCDYHQSRKRCSSGFTRNIDAISIIQLGQPDQLDPIVDSYVS